MENFTEGYHKTDIKFGKPKLCYLKNEIDFNLVNNVQERLSTFIGREKELIKIENDINKTRISIINGLAGSGKSALANEFLSSIFATTITKQFKDLCQMDSISDT